MLGPRKVRRTIDRERFPTIGRLARLPSSSILPLFACLLLPIACSSSGTGGAGGAPSSQAGLDRILRAGVLRVGTNPGYKPFEMIDTKGQIIGFDIEVANYLAKEMGVRLELVQTDWDPVIANLNAGKFDIIISGMTRTLSRALACSFTDPYFKTGQALLLNAAKHPPGSVRGYEDLNKEGIVISTRLGTTGEIAARAKLPEATIRTFEHESDAAIEVDQGKADAMVYDQPFLAFHQKESGGRSWAILEPFTSEYLAFAVRKTEPDLRDWLNLAIFEMKESGEYDKWFQKWFVDMPWIEQVKS